MSKLFFPFFIFLVGSALFYLMIVILQFLILAGGSNPFTLSISRLGTTFFFTVFPSMLLAGTLAIIVLTRGRRSSEQGSITYNPIHRPSICAVLTAYNDEAPIYDSTRDFLGQKFVDKVLVIDNNSSDSTTPRALDAGATVISESKQGYGYACIRGLSEALKNDSCNIVALCEGDQTFHAYDLKKLVPYLDNSDMVVGTRVTQELLDQNSQIDIFYAWGNLFLAKLIQLKFFDVKCLGKVRLTDVGCTYRVIRTESLRKIIDQLIVGGHHFSPHMIMVALRNNLKVIEIPVTFTKRVGISKGAGGDKKKGLRVGLQMLYHILSS